MDQVWKSAADFPDYEVSPDGQVRRIGRVQRIRNRWGSWTDRSLAAMPIRPVKTGNRLYLAVGLTRGDERVMCRLNALVCRTFHGEPPQGKECALHINGDRYDNRADNLRWGDDKDNAADRARHGRTAKGERQHSARFTADQVKLVRSRVAKGETAAAVAREYGVNKSSVQRMVDRQSWRHVA